MNFDELNLAPAILKAVREQGYDSPTPIQAHAPIITGTAYHAESSIRPHHIGTDVGRYLVGSRRLHHPCTAAAYRRRGY